MACNDDEEVLSASASSPEEAAQPKLKKAKKAPSGSRPPAIDVIDVDEQKEHLMSDESQSGSPDIEMTKTGEELRHPRANPSIEFLYATNLSHTFGGAYPRVLNELKKMYKAVKGEEGNASALGLARFAGWVRHAPRPDEIPVHLCSAGMLTLLVSHAGRGLAPRPQGGAWQLARARVVPAGVMGPRCALPTASPPCAAHLHSVFT